MTLAMIGRAGYDISFPCAWRDHLFSDIVKSDLNTLFESSTKQEPG
jgi:hypothetical protein